MTGGESIRLLPWGVPQTGPRFAPASTYAEGVWLPVLGPTSFLLWRHLSRQLDLDPGGTTVNPALLAAALGLGSAEGRQSPIVRSMRRLQRFGVVRVVHDGLVLVRCSLPPVPIHRLERLHPVVRAAHGRCLDREERPTASSVPAQRSVDPSDARQAAGRHPVAGGVRVER